MNGITILVTRLSSSKGLKYYLSKIFLSNKTLVKATYMRHGPPFYEVARKEEGCNVMPSSTMTLEFLCLSLFKSFIYIQVLYRWLQPFSITSVNPFSFSLFFFFFFFLCVLIIESCYSFRYMAPTLALNLSSCYWILIP